MTPRKKRDDPRMNSQLAKKDIADRRALLLICAESSGIPAQFVGSWYTIWRQAKLSLRIGQTIYCGRSAYDTEFGYGRIKVSFTPRSDLHEAVVMKDPGPHHICVKFLHHYDEMICTLKSLNNGMIDSVYVLNAIGGPSVILKDGSKSWHRNGLLHRTNGPAQTYPSGIEEWLYDGELHRIDGPAIVTDYSKEYYCHGELHNDNGPAVVYNSGFVEYYRNGIKCDQPL